MREKVEPDPPLLAKIIERAEMLDNDTSIPPDKKPLLLAEFIERSRRSKSGEISSVCGERMTSG